MRLKEYFRKFSFAALIFFSAAHNCIAANAEVKDSTHQKKPDNQTKSKLGDPEYKIDPIYTPIYGSPIGKSFFLYYCLPDFSPNGLNDCSTGFAPGQSPVSVQVQYTYSLGDPNIERMRLEGSPAFKFPFPVNTNIKGKTPYIEQYMRMSKLAKKGMHNFVSRSDDYKEKYVDLDYYKSPLLPGGWWIPKDIHEYKTRLGNPPLFVCSQSFCFITLDQGNGWVVEATFNEVALKEWRTLLLKLNESIDKIMEY